MKALPQALPSKQIKPAVAVGLGVVYTLGLGILDYSMPTGMSLALFYVVGIAFVAWRAAAAPAVFVALLSGLAAALARLGAPQTHHIWVWLWNLVTAWAFFCTLAWLVARISGSTKHLGKLVEQQKSEYEAILATAMDGFVVLDLNGRITDVSESFSRLLGYSREELAGRTVADFEANESPEEVSRHMAAIHEHGSDHFETRHRNKMGQLLDVEVNVSRMAGDNAVLVAFVREIGDQKSSEFLLQAQRDLGRNLSLTSDLTTALKALLEVAMKFEGIDAGGVYLRESDTGDLRLAAHCGSLTPGFIKEASFVAAGTERARLVETGQPVFDLYGRFPQSRDDGPANSPFRATAVIPLTHEGTVIGSLNLASQTVDSFPRKSRIGLELIAAQAAGAIVRIRAETQRQQLEAQLLETTDREQARIGQEIHDGLCQQLVSLAFDANTLQRDLVANGRPEAAVATRIADYLDEAITEARRLSRGLFPIRLQGEGLLSALEELARSTSARFATNCVFECTGTLAVENPAVATHLFRIAQEAVTNAVKHGRATSISIRLRSYGGKLDLDIEDDGVGMGSERQAGIPGMGLHIMEYRARSVGGNLRVDCGTHGGTTICCCVPFLHSENTRL